MILTIYDKEAYARAFAHARLTDTVDILAVVIADMCTWNGQMTIRGDGSHNLSFSQTRESGSMVHGGIIYHEASNTWGVHT